MTAFNILMLGFLRRLKTWLMQGPSDYILLHGGTSIYYSDICSNQTWIKT